MSAVRANRPEERAPSLSTDAARGSHASGGSACSSGSNKGSHVLAALYPERPGANIRFSFSRFTTADEVDRTVAILKRILQPVPVNA